MCTAISYNATNNYFGRNLDYEHGFGEKILITPRNYHFCFKNSRIISQHFAMIGAGIEIDGYPLYFDAINEHGLGIAGLNFPGNAHYFEATHYPDGIAPYELIPFLLGNCRNIGECMAILKDLTLVDMPFSDALQLSPLHWMLADSAYSVVIEPTAEGVQIYKNPAGILTNNPPFEYHMHNLSNYMHLSPCDPVNQIAPDLQIKAYSRGMGAIGLPGDNSSASRFIRAAFTKFNSLARPNATDEIVQFFHILNSVYQINGCTQTEGECEKTIYSCCCDMNNRIYYYTTYENPQLTAVALNNFNLDATKVQSVEFNRKIQIMNSL